MFASRSKRKSLKEGRSKKIFSSNTIHSIHGYSNLTKKFYCRRQLFENFLFLFKEFCKEYVVSLFLFFFFFISEIIFEYLKLYLSIIRLEFNKYRSIILAIIVFDCSVNWIGKSKPKLNCIKCISRGIY